MMRRIIPLVAAAAILGLYAACSDNPTTVPKTAVTPGSPLRDAFKEGTGACMGDNAFASGFTSGMGSASDLNCTANDIDIAFATVTQYRFNDTLGTFTTLNPGDRISCVGGQHIFVRTHAFLENNAQDRYDVGLWIATDGGTAVTGTCNHYALNTADPNVSNKDGDTCGDMSQGAGLVDVNLDILEVVCPTNGDTAVSIGACVGWQNSDDFNQRGACPTTPPGAPDGFRLGTVPETKSKCNCEPFALPVDVKASLTLVKVVTNNSGGNKTVNDFPLTATGPTSFSGVSGTTAVTAVPVNGGTYALSEQTQAGYTPSSWSCSGGTQSGANITVAAGGAATCTISNDDQPASLTLVKVVTNNNGGTRTVTDFPLTATGPTTISGVSGTTSVTGRQVNAGTYALTEQTQAGYAASSWSCSGGTQSGANISVGLGGSATCTISNDDQTANLTLVKVVTNNNGGTRTVTDFPLTATGPTTISGVSGTTSVTGRNVNSGTYALSEQTQAGYTASSWSCSGGTQSGSNVTLGLGGSATCTISNDDIGASLTLVKVVTNNSGGTATVNDFPLTASGPQTISGVSGTTAVTNRGVSAGSYALSEQTVAGYTASSWSCSGGTQSGANITLALAGAATCTISNDDQPAHLTLVKVVTNNNGGSRTVNDFPLTATGPTSISGVSGTTAVTNATVNAGAYALSEQTQAGYTASSWSCSGGTQSGANITLGLNGSATCTISNDDQPASLTLVKVVTNNSGGTATVNDFPLTASGPQTISGVSGTTAVTNRGVNAGTYALSEQTVAGYTPSTWSCTGGTQSGANISLGVAGAATCTISNDDQPAHLTLVKVVTNDNGGTKTVNDFPLTATGPTSINGVSGTTAVTNRQVNAGSYALSEQTQAGYAASSWSCSGGTQSGSNIALGLNGSATCTISNNDIAPKLIIKKTVKGGSASFSFTATSNGSFITSPFTLTPPANSSDSVVYTTTAKAGPFTVTEGANSYVLTDLGCSDQPVGTYNPVSTRTVIDTLSLGETVTCTFVNQQPSNTTRTQGFWATHRLLTDSVWFGGTIGGHTFAGVTEQYLCPSRPIDTEGKLLGGFWSNISKTTTNDKRSSLDQARMQLAQQLLAAILNNAAFGSSPTGTISLDSARTAYCGTDISQIQDAMQQMAAFNTSGDNGVFTPGISANGKDAKDAANLVFWDVLP